MFGRHTLKTSNSPNLAPDLENRIRKLEDNTYPQRRLATMLAEIEHVETQLKSIKTRVEKIALEFPS